MASLKWIFVVLFGLGSAGSLAMAFVTGGTPYAATERTAPPLALALRKFPQMLARAERPLAPPSAEGKSPEPVDAAPPEPVAAKPAAPVAPKPSPVVAARPEPVAAKPAEANPEPVAEKLEPLEPVVAPPPAEPKEPKPEPEPVAAAPKAPPAEGMLNLRASDTADVYLDGKKLGGSPLLGIKARAGNHKVRFDCYDAAGNTVAGPTQTITVKADAEVEVEYPCPVE